jgi:hypothetical protein
VTLESQRIVFRHIAQLPYYDWPTYDSTPLYDRSSLDAIEEDVRTVSGVWFKHEAHDSVDEFVCRLSLAYFEFSQHDQYSSSTQFEMEPLFRALLLKEIHGWTHETALVEYLRGTPEICQQFGFWTLPDQSTFWRTWHKRFTTALRNIIQTAARTILLKADDAGVSIPREPPDTLSRSDTEEEAPIDEQTLLKRSEDIADQVSRTVFRSIAQRSYVEWPAYDSTPLNDRMSLAALELDARTVSETWFSYESHDSVEQFVCSLPLAYFKFEPHDRYGRSTRYEMDTLFRVFVLKELHGWGHETALVKFLDCHPEWREQLGLKRVPNQSTLWRSWHERFTAELRETVETAAQTILINAQNADVSIPRDPDRTLPQRGNNAEESDLDGQTVLEQAGTITNHVSRVVFPAFSLDRGEGC